jgi:hypothetical protein
MSKREDEFSSPAEEAKDETSLAASTASGSLSRSGWAVVYVALAAFLAAPAAQANTSAAGDQASSLKDRLAAAKGALLKAEQPGTDQFNLAQWFNGPWGNWNNWHNWHNWSNGIWLNL